MKWLTLLIEKLVELAWRARKPRVPRKDRQKEIEDRHGR